MLPTSESPADQDFNSFLRNLFPLPTILIHGFFFYLISLLCIAEFSHTLQFSIKCNLTVHDFKVLKYLLLPFNFFSYRHISLSPPPSFTNCSRPAAVVFLGLLLLSSSEFPCPVCVTSPTPTYPSLSWFTYLFQWSIFLGSFLKKYTEDNFFKKLHI